MPPKLIRTTDERVFGHGSELWPEWDINDDIRAKVEALPEKMRAAVEMRFFGRLTFQEIADRMGWPGRNYAHQYMLKGLKRLRKEMEDGKDNNPGHP